MELHVLATFSFLTEVDLMLLMRECFGEIELAKGEVLLSQVC
jgi:hypothetical protein